MEFIKSASNLLIRATTKISPLAGSHLLYFRGMRRPLRLRNPQYFSEKLMLLKLEQYNNDKTVWLCADKMGVREFAQRHGVEERNLPRVLGVYEDARDIEFDSLPRKMALKCTHGAGFNIICQDKGSLDREEAVRKLNKWLVTPFGLDTAETHYGKVPPKIICEAFIESEDSGLPNDYKIYCFNGVPLYVMACTDRTEVSKVNIMDIAWNDTGFIKSTYSSNHAIYKPKTLSGMLEIAAKVSKDFPFVRVDFYEDKGEPILGEMTFTPHACVNSNMTKEGQIVLGRALKLGSRS